MVLKVKYFSDELDRVAYSEGKGEGIDLRSAEEVSLKKGDYHLLNLGIAVQLPEGYEAHVVPRSSTFKNFGIIQTNHMGVIDNSYSGDNDLWKWPILAMRDTTIHVNDRVCQFRIMKNQPRLVFEEVDHLSGPDRGGFGSTGR
ncbi:MAG: deoxyuridine 5'-triphosphate nucleotidohydrolase [Lachnospiraceae bacterium]|nr:deoxyuridine 5'-triphosphate nucleotidohydrolase [Lachnospiraceae bacterium]